jgi:CHAD domain-containing protein
MASGKWIGDITAETPTVDAARRVLGLRLETLRDALGCVFHVRDDSFDEVHQLRVAARRASAALAVFEPCLTKKAFRSASRRLRRLRRAAGAARDLDVLLKHYIRQIEQNDPKDASALDLLSGAAISERIRAQSRLDAACEGYPFEFEKWMSKTIAALVAPPREVAHMQALGRQYLGRLCNQLGMALRASSPSYDQMHALRVVAKRLRYAMEVFGESFAAPFREDIYPRVAELQEILGAVSDAHVGLARTEELLRGLVLLLPASSARWQTSLAGCVEELKRARLEGREQFESWKNRANQTGFETLLLALLDSASVETSARSYPIDKAS